MEHIPQSSPRADAYIQLLKNCLCFALYEERYIPLKFAWQSRGKIKRALAQTAKFFVTLLPKLAGTQVFQPSNYTRHQMETGAFWPQQAHSMIGLQRMTNLQECMQTVLDDGIPGDFIETGVWRGGACIFMRGILKAYEVPDRNVYVADSFAGLPKPDTAHYPADRGDKHYTYDALAISMEQVQENFKKYDLLDDQVVFLKGWFKDTLPTISGRRFAVIRLDGDMYESTMDAFNNLYSSLSPGGFCIIDDYCLPRCRRAVHDYREQHGIKEPIMPIDGNGSFWRKE